MRCWWIFEVPELFLRDFRGAFATPIRFGFSLKTCNLAVELIAVLVPAEPFGEAICAFWEDNGTASAR
jgi:hypothetical protein